MLDLNCDFSSFSRNKIFSHFHLPNLVQKPVILCKSIVIRLNSQDNF